MASSHPSDHGSPKVPPSERIPIKEKIAYGLGNVGSGIQERADKELLGPIFVLQVGLTPTAMSMFGLLYRLWDAVTDAVMGWVSDNTRSRWGRRKPYIVAGAIMMGLWMPVLFFFNPSWSVSTITLWMVGSMLVLYLTNTIFNIPYQCMLLEITQNSTERTNVATWRAYFGQAVSLVLVWMWWLVQRPIFHNAAGEVDVINGARWVTSALGVLVIVIGILPALFVKERFYHQAEKQAKHSLWKNMRMSFSNRPFVILVTLTMFMSVGGGIKWGLDFYTKLYYVCGGDQEFAARLSGIQGTIMVFAALAGIPIFQWLARRFGKLRALQIALYIMLGSSLATWVAYTPAMPYLSLLPGILLSPVSTAVWVLIPSLTGDVVDYDELQTGERREGSFASVFSWTLKFSLSLSAAISGPLVDLAGFRPELRNDMPDDVILNMRLLLAFAPVVLFIPAFIAAHRFPLTTTVIEENRIKLDQRRADAS